jgi:hypothetical protein
MKYLVTITHSMKFEKKNADVKEFLRKLQGQLKNAEVRGYEIRKWH